MGEERESLVKVPTSPRDKDFFKSLGARIAALRKEVGMTQVQLAKILGCSQQQIVSFEKARCRVPASALPILATAFGVSSDELLGTSGQPLKRHPASRLGQQLERLSKLPRSQQRVVSEMLEGYLQRASQAA